MIAPVSLCCEHEMVVNNRVEVFGDAVGSYDRS